MQEHHPGQLEQALTQYLVNKANRTDDFPEDVLFDMQSEVLELILEQEYIGFFDHENKVDEELILAVESYIGTTTDLIKPQQSEERSEKMAKEVLKKARSILSRIKSRT